MTPEVGQTAPDFNLIDQDGQSFSLGQFKGQKTVILSFYVFDFTGG